MINDNTTVYLLFEQYFGEAESVFAAYRDQDEARAALERYVSIDENDELRSDFYGIISLKLLFDRNQLNVDDPYGQYRKEIVYDFSLLNAMGDYPTRMN